MLLRGRRVQLGLLGVRGRGRGGGQGWGRSRIEVGVRARVRIGAVRASARVSGF